MSIYDFVKEKFLPYLVEIIEVSEQRPTPLRMLPVETNGVRVRDRAYEIEEELYMIADNVTTAERRIVKEKNFIELNESYNRPYINFDEFEVPVSTEIAEEVKRFIEIEFRKTAEGVERYPRWRLSYIIERKLDKIIGDLLNFRINENIKNNVVDHYKNDVQNYKKDLENTLSEKINQEMLKKLISEEFVKEKINEEAKKHFDNYLSSHGELFDQFCHERVNSLLDAKIKLYDKQIEEKMKLLDNKFEERINLYDSKYSDILKSLTGNLGERLLSDPALNPVVDSKLAALFTSQKREFYLLVKDLFRSVRGVLRNELTKEELDKIKIPNI
jgi:hypothetical protein